MNLVRLFDLDGTLMRGDSFFNMVQRQHVPKIYTYIAAQMNLPLAQAQVLSDGYFIKYGSTLEGLRLHHGFDPDAYFQATFSDLDYSVVLHDAPLCEAFAHMHEKTPQVRNVVFTNSPTFYAQKVLERVGLASYFSEIFDPPRVKFVPKTRPEAFLHVCSVLNAVPEDTWLFEDDPNNARAAQRAGLKAVYIQHTESDRVDISYVTQDLAAFLKEVVTD